TVAFTAPGTIGAEGALGTFPVTLDILPATITGGTITLNVANGAGATYGAGGDYTTAPAVAAGTITLTVPPGATSASFTMTVNDDAVIEDLETVTFTLVSVTGDMVIGASTHVATIQDDDTPPTVLDVGDLLIVGVNANNFACSGASGEDLVSFFCLKPIGPGTTIDITDNGYERQFAGYWGTSEGTVRLTRTGGAIPAGQVITFRISNTAGNGNVTGVAPDNGWSCTSLNGPAAALNLNSGGDQIFFMQGGTWSTGGPHLGSYTGGKVLYGLSTNGQWLSFANHSQQSGLPIQMECFSMAPTASSDFAKYSGPLNAVSQRDWIIRVEDPANWTSLASCVNYNTQAPDWLTAPILPIIPGPMVHGRWRGSTSTDWFECKNWDDARIPDATTDVVIDPTWAARNCVVGLTGPGAAECASLLQTTAGTARNLIVQDNSSLDIHGLLHMVRTAGTGPLNATVAGGSQLVADSVRLEGPAATTVLLRAQANAALLTVHGDLRILPGGCLNLQGTGEGGTLHLGGDWANAGTEAMFLHQNSTVRLNGNGPQAIHVGTGYELFNDLVIDKPAGDVTLHAPIEVIGNLDLQSGRVMNNAGEPVTIRNTGAALNASHNSFVHGPVRKNGNTDFTYPVGKGNVYRPCMLSELTGNNSVAFTAEYFLASPRTTFNDVIEQPPLHHISDCEYWTIDRSFGTPDARVTLSWHDPTSCIVDELPTLRVARWDGTMWLDRGNGGTTGNFAAGTIATDAVQTAFSPWTLASLNENNPLPVELLHFDARPDGRVTDLSWATASEQGNAHFTVERSADGEQFMDLLQVAGAGYSAQLLHYTAVDAQPLPGLSFYRLRQTDLDGTATWSRTVPVHFSGTGGLAVHADAELLTVFHAHLPGTRYELRDMTGRLLMHGTVAQAGPMHLPAHTLPPGAYMLRMVHGAGAESVRFVK
ncbi:MAG: T9SS type A sorting domain-containing protein, partial [Flavobacteriales bacterium]|nr:T9SS type A sorting domain-containing protein [Flavobacteriales bacterium]